jgi:hypothetical protein
MINNMIDMGSKVNLLKVRGGYAQVGNDTSPYSLYASYYDAGQWGDAIRLGKPGSLLNPNLLPEEATSYEVGLDFKGFDNRLRFEGTYYKEDNRNQILGVPLAGSTGFGSIKVNAGLLQSKGWEFSLGYTVIKSTDWTWDLTANFTTNDTYLLELTEGVDFVEFWDGAKVKNIAWVKGNYAGPDGKLNTSDDINQDGLIGNLYTRKLVRVTDKNSPYYNYPLLENSDGYLFWDSAEDYTKIGNYNPDFIMGLQSALRFKNFSLNMTFDWRSGGQYASQTYHYLVDGGVSKSWQEQLVNPPQGLGGQPSQALQEWVVANADQLIYTDKFRPIGGVTKEDGGFYTDFYTGLPAYDGTFVAGVLGHYDNNGNFILEKENLGGPGTSIVPYAGTTPWDFGEAKTFDADYIKLREIALSYNLPSKYTSKIGISDVNFSIYSRNIMIWAKDSGMGIDPERAYQSESSGRFRQGIERFNAEPWTVPVGFKIGFSF